MLQIGLLTMYNEDPTILNSTYFPLPEGIDHTTLDPLLLAETAELELLYPEPNTLKTVIYAWSMARNPAWAKILAALEAEYSPIENYDRSEDWTDTRNLADNHTGSENRQSSGQSAATSTGQEATTNTGQEASTSTGQEATSSSGSDTETVVGYNDTDWTNKGKHETSESLNSSSNSTNNISTSGEENRSTSTTSSVSTSDNENRTNQAADTHTGTIRHTSRIHGNIGVTTAQQMIEAELELRKMDIYNLIVKEFIKMFCLGVY